MVTSLVASLVLFVPPVGGLQVKIVRAGTGVGAANGDVLTMLYRGTLKNGVVFDENLKSAPYAFKLGAGEVISGWDQGLNGAKVGAKMRLWIPPDLGFGSRANGKIPANSPLIFDVEVLRIDRPNDRPAIKIVELKKGTGALATPNSHVSVMYKGTFLNGMIFDQSHGSPYMFQLSTGGAVRGFEDGIKGMRVGGKRKVTIPYRLAYGESGRPPKIPRMATLVFELELMSASR